MSDLYDARERLILDLLHLVSARQYAEVTPEQERFAILSEDYATDALDDSARHFVEALDASIGIEPEREPDPITMLNNTDWYTDIPPIAARFTIEIDDAKYGVLLNRHGFGGVEGFARQAGRMIAETLTRHETEKLRREVTTDLVPLE